MSHAHSIGVARKLKDLASRGNLKCRGGGRGWGGILGQPRCSLIQNLKSKILQRRDYQILPQGPYDALPKL